MVKREGQQQVSLWMANHVFDWLEELREFFDVDRATMIKQLIADGHGRMLEKKKAGNRPATPDSFFALLDKALESRDEKDFKKAEKEMDRLKKQATLPPTGRERFEGGRLPGQESDEGKEGKRDRKGS